MNSTDTAGARSSGATRRLDRLRSIYERIDRSQSESLSEISRRGPELACPRGCGVCCEGFIPDVLPVEAEYLADWLLRFRPDVASDVAERGEAGFRHAPPCPFYGSEREGGHCEIYPARPLVCRLFGFSAIRDREGCESYSLCKAMPPRGSRRSWSGEELARELGADLPVMSDYSSMTIALAPEEAGRRELLTEALPAALRALFLRLRFRSLESRDDTDGGDEPGPSEAA